MRPAGAAARGDRCRVLTLDGGGTKGFQTLGVLKELERLVGRPLGAFFDLIYGTSTGACTGALLALGARVEDIVGLYREHIPAVLRERTPAGKSAALGEFCRTAFGVQGFSAFHSRVGIMCTDWRRLRPVVLQTESAPPGLGCTIARAVRASCSAYPVFESTRVRLEGLGTRELVDGSYCANNPVVFAVAHALTGLRQSHSSLRVVSVGVGTYPQPAYHGWKGIVRLFGTVGALQKTFGINTEAMEQLRADLFPDVAAVRINDHFPHGATAVDFIESDPRKFDLLFQCGRRSFRRHEPALRRLLGETEGPRPRRAATSWQEPRARPSGWSAAPARPTAG